MSDDAAPVSSGTKYSSKPIDAPAPPQTGDETFPVGFSRWATTLIHTENEVWISHMRVEHGRENHKPDEWHALLDTYRNQPAHPGA